MKICVLAGMVFHYSLIVGGAERFLLKILRSLSNYYCFDVICDVKSDINNEHNILFHKVVNSYNQDSIIEQLFANADIIWSIDRLVDRKYQKHRILTLGSFDYAFCIEAVKFGQWDLIITMSEWLQLEIAKHTTNKVISIPLFVDQKFNLKACNQKNEILRFISPHRPDLNKGHFESIDLLNQLNKIGIKSILYFPDWPETYNNGRDFKKKIIKYGIKKGIHNFIHFYKWSPDNFYKEYDFVLRLGSYREGFGLSIIEAICSLKPVICTGNGNLKYILPDKSGVLKVNSPILGEDFLMILDFIESSTLKDDLMRGKKYISMHYTEKKMIESYKHIFDELL